MICLEGNRGQKCCHGGSFQKISFLLGAAKTKILKRKKLQTQVMYVALIGLQFIERIYIGPNEANGFIATLSS